VFDILLPYLSEPFAGLALDHFNHDHFNVENPKAMAGCA